MLFSQLHPLLSVLNLKSFQERTSCLGWAREFAVVAVFGFVGLWLFQRVVARPCSLWVWAWELYKLMEMEGGRAVILLTLSKWRRNRRFRRPIFRRRPCRFADRREEAGGKSFGWSICVELGDRGVIRTLSPVLLRPWKYIVDSRESCVLKKSELYFKRRKKLQKKICLVHFSLKKSIFRGLINLTVVGCLRFCIGIILLSCMDDSV